MFWKTRLIVAGVVALVASVVAAPASADAIDGHWCSAQGRTFTIDGPRIETPGGNQIRGLYDRHGFMYTVPEGEPGAGADIRMVLVNDSTVQLTVGDGGEVQTWRRCRPGIS